MTAKRPKKKLGIHIELTIYDTKRNLTEEENENFLEVLIHLVEEKGWLCGGGSHLCDLTRDCKGGALQDATKSWKWRRG